MKGWFGKNEWKKVGGGMAVARIGAYAKKEKIIIVNIS